LYEQLQQVAGSPGRGTQGAFRIVQEDSEMKTRTNVKAGKAGGDKVKYIEYKMKEVFIS
jgi:hypothetical protein